MTGGWPSLTVSPVRLVVVGDGPLAARVGQGAGGAVVILAGAVHARPDGGLRTTPLHMTVAVHVVPALAVVWGRKDLRTRLVVVRIRRAVLCAARTADRRDRDAHA